MKNINTFKMDIPHMLLFLQLLALTCAVPLDDQLTSSETTQASTNTLQPNPLTKPIFQSTATPPSTEEVETQSLQVDKGERLTTGDNYAQDTVISSKRKGGERKEFARFPY